MKKLIVIFSILIAISCQQFEQKVENSGEALIEIDNLLGVNRQEYKNDIVIFRQTMENTIESISLDLSLVRKRIENENQQTNPDFDKSIFELDLISGYLKMKMEEYNRHGTNKWKVFKSEFSKEIDEWNIAFADFASTI